MGSESIPERTGSTKEETEKSNTRETRGCEMITDTKMNPIKRLIYILIIVVIGSWGVLYIYKVLGIVVAVCVGGIYFGGFLFTKGDDAK
jgi:hypothetical protein